MLQEVIASLERARITIQDGACQLDEYNFESNSWHVKELHSWPLTGEDADRWLTGWTRYDHFKARNLLIRPEPD